ncbi:golgin candidate 5-like [Pyrus ussuriensis x Pyrus communis]|uniref:Golgin candidate 5-like n=1 Tax=Pyrus ussuriensis x Pyrus communis TaxID=2448454 RepID=A0A5N5GCR3_9ROSA|nr:golgin candidate 5-like [Pyrus ussuriensis x Pyrus communis]
MAWFSGKVSLGNFPDLAGAVNKLQESVKNIEKNFDSALGFEDREKPESGNEASGLWPSSTERIMSFMGQQDEESNVESSEKAGSSEFPPKVDKSPGETESLQLTSTVEEKEGAKAETLQQSTTEQTAAKEENEVVKEEKDDNPVTVVGETKTVIAESEKSESESSSVAVEQPESTVKNSGPSDSVDSQGHNTISMVGPSESSESSQEKSGSVDADQVEETRTALLGEAHGVVDVHEKLDEHRPQVEKDGHMTQVEENVDMIFPVEAESSTDSQPRGLDEPSFSTEEIHSVGRSSTNQLPDVHPSDDALDTVSELVLKEQNAVVEEPEVDQRADDNEADVKEQHLSSGENASGSSDALIELEKVKMEMKMMEAALQGAARQAQAKADEIAKFMNENEQLKAVIEDLKRKSSDAEVESLREEYHQRVATLERKVYALTKERDTLRREQNKKSDAAALLKEKDEIINQVMAEGEELSKKQAAQEAQIRKLRAQIRELEEEKKGLSTKLQVEENKVESIKKDKTATEKLLQESIEKHQTELALQKEYYTNALAAAKEAEAMAEARANDEARSELEKRLKEGEEREALLVQALEELRQTLTRKEQQAVFREDMLRRDIEDLQKRYQASERRCEELITQVPESTRPLLRQIEAMQETTSRRAEAWAAVERSLNSRLQEAEAKAAAAEERERSVNERLSQTLSRINVLEAQISCLRAEQSQLSKSVEKERQRAAENRQEYLAAKEEADTQEGRASQLEEEIRELRRKHKQDLQDALMHRELLQQEVEREKAARLELEKTAHVRSATVSDQTTITRHNSAVENGSLSRKLSSASSLGSMEESYFLQASLDSSDGFSERRNAGEATMSPYYMKSMTPSAFEASLRQKEGELASYMSRLASMESIRDSLAEELVKMTEQCEKLRAEAVMLPGMRAELDALRRRHSAALELMGERDEELEELRADIVDLKEMYREQVNLLVNKIQIMSSSVGA